LGSRPITAIGKGDVARLHNAMAGKPGAANRCLALFDSVWNWAVRRSEIAALPSPTKGLERNPERSRERYLSADELRRLGKALRDAETIGLPWLVDETGPKAKHLPKAEKRATAVAPYAVAAIRLLMLTGARLREILTARRDYIDWDRGLMFLPDSKTGWKTLYLSEVSLALLEDLPKVAGNPHIIPGEGKEKPRADLKRPWAAIVRAAGLLHPGSEGQGESPKTPDSPHPRPQAHVRSDGRRLLIGPARHRQAARLFPGADHPVVCPLGR
jgi:integrase